MAYGVRVIDETSDRARRWTEVFGRPVAPVESVISEKVPFTDGLQECYFMALDQITPEQRAALIRHLVELWGDTVDVVERELDQIGLPIPADGVELVELGTATAR